MLSLKIAKHLKTAKTVFKEKSIYLFVYSLYMTLSFLNDLYFNIEKMVKRPSASQNFFMNQEEDFRGNIIAISQLRNQKAAKENIHWERA